jgi:hypothetical protein
MPELGDTIDRLLSDVDTMFGHAQSNVHNSIADAFDGVSGPNARAGRIVVINQAVKASAARISQRAQASAAVAVHAGSNEALRAIFDRYQTQYGVPGLMKRWRVMATDPCGMCRELDGTMVGINGEFDHNATENDKDYRRVWRNLLGPPRHPNCRCQLELVVT